MHLTQGDVQQVARFSKKKNEHTIFTKYYGNETAQSAAMDDWMSSKLPV